MARKLQEDGAHIRVVGRRGRLEAVEPLAEEGLRRPWILPVQTGITDATLTARATTGEVLAEVVEDGLLKAARVEARLRRHNSTEKPNWRA